MSLLCEAFHCLPSEARDELGTDPDRLALQVLEMRAYAETKRRLETAKTVKDRPTGPLANLVEEIEVDIWRERKDRRGR